MAISSIERRGSYYEIFDERGKKIQNVSNSLGELLGWSDSFFVLLKGSYYVTYDERGRFLYRISSSLGNFVSITGDQFILRDGSRLCVYNKFGKRIDTRPAR